jgi:hypothetical protein
MSIAQRIEQVWPQAFGAGHCRVTFSQNLRGRWAERREIDQPDPDISLIRADGANKGLTADEFEYIVNGTRRAPKTWWIISGKADGDEHDQTHVIQARYEEEAVAAFAARLCRKIGFEVEVYINHIAQSLTEVTVIDNGEQED